MGFFRRWKGSSRAEFLVELAYAEPNSKRLIAEGRLERGFLREGMKGRAGGKKCRVEAIEVFSTPVREAFEGQECTLTLSGLKEGEVGRGHRIVFG